MATKWTEDTLRQYLADIFQEWLGAKRGSLVHRQILTIYNSYRPLARNYAVKVNDAWCATTVSAAWIKAGIAKYTGTECSCAKLIEIAKSKKCWVENDAYVPKIGDCLLYDWDDDGVGDCLGTPEHIGMVIKVANDYISVIEGNKGSNSVVGIRTVKINSRYIRGFITPNYAYIANELNKNIEEGDDMLSQEEFEKMYETMMSKRNDNDSSSWSAEAREWAVDNGIISGVGNLPNGKPNYAWEAIPTREQLVTILYRVISMLK